MKNRMKIIMNKVINHFILNLNYFYLYYQLAYMSAYKNNKINIENSLTLIFLIYLYLFIV